MYMHIKLTLEELPKNIIKFVLKIMSGIGLFISSIGRKGQSLKGLKYVVRLLHSVRRIGKSRSKTIPSRVEPVLSGTVLSGKPLLRG